MLNRRKFVKTSSASVAGLVITPNLLVPNMELETKPVCIFSKCLQFLSYNELGKVVANLGFDGVDLTVRNGGHVLPENVKTDLPKVVQALKKSNINVPMITTGINDANHQFTEHIIGTAADMGIKYYRMGSLGYNDKLSVFENLNNCKREIEKLERINRKYNIKGGYQNHSGPWGMVGGAVWDLFYVLKDFDQEFIGVQYDIAHATVEGGFSWALALKIIEPWINSLAIKDFLWEEGEKRWEPKWSPLGEGMVDFKKYANEASTLLATKPITIHCEYNLGGAELGKMNPSMPAQEIYKYLKKDLQYLRTNILRNS